MLNLQARGENIICVWFGLPYFIWLKSVANGICCSKRYCLRFCVNRKLQNSSFMLDPVLEYSYKLIKNQNEIPNRLILFLFYFGNS